MLPQHFDIEPAFKAVFSEDGRVFYNLDLIADMVENSAEEFESEIETPSEYFDGYVEGLRTLARSLRYSRESLILEDTLKNS